MENKMTMKEVWDYFSSLNVNKYTEKKGPRKLTYLQWAVCWQIVKELDPHARWEVKEFEHSKLTRNYVGKDNHTCDVKVKITICGWTHTFNLPVMDYKMDSVEAPTSRHISDAIARCMVKCVAVNFGLGLYLYQGLDKPLCITNTLKGPEDKGGVALSESHTHSHNSTSQGPSIKNADHGETVKTVHASSNGDSFNKTILIGQPEDAGRSYKDVYGDDLVKINDAIKFIQTKGNKHKNAKNHYEILLSYKEYVTTQTSINSSN